MSASPVGLPFAVRASTPSFTPAPTASGAPSDAISIWVMLCGLMTTVAKAGFPSTIAPTLASPGRKNVTLPASSVAATSNGAATHVIVLASNRRPSSSYADASNLSVSPTSTSRRAGETSTRAGLATAAAFGSCADVCDGSENAARTMRPATPACTVRMVKAWLPPRRFRTRNDTCLASYQRPATSCQSGNRKTESWRLEAGAFALCCGRGATVVRLVVLHPGGSHAPP